MIVAWLFFRNQTFWCQFQQKSFQSNAVQIKLRLLQIFLDNLNLLIWLSGGNKKKRELFSCWDAHSIQRLSFSWQGFLQPGIKVTYAILLWKKERSAENFVSLRMTNGCWPIHINYIILFYEYRSNTLSGVFCLAAKYAKIINIILSISKDSNKAWVYYNLNKLCTRKRVKP